MKKMIMTAAVCLLTAMSAMAQEKVFVENFTATIGQEAEVGLLFNNTAEYCAMQFDLFLPSGVSIVKDEGLYVVEPNQYSRSNKNGRTVDHSIAVDKAANGAFRFIISSNTNQLFKGNEGTIATIILTAEEGAAKGEQAGSIEDVIVVKADGTKVTLDKVNFTVNVSDATAIKAMKMDLEEPADVYDLKGNKVRANATTLTGLQKGVYVVNGQKRIIR